MQTIIAKCGTTRNVSRDHPLLSQGVFLMINLDENTGIDLDFLDFAFNGNMETPVKHAKMAFVYGLRDLTRNTLFAHIETIDEIPEELKHLFSWYELPDRLAVQLLTDPSFEDLTRVVKLGYSLCYKKYANEIARDNYRDLKTDFFSTVVETIGVDKSFAVCCANGHLEMAQTLVSMGANVRILGNHVMIYAAAEGHLKMVRYLVSLGANVRTRDDNATMCAAGNGHLEMVQYLVSLGANVRTRDDEAVIWAAGSRNLEMVQYLVSLGADVRAQDGAAMLHAAGSRNLEMVQYLVSLGVDVRARDDGAIIHAASSGDLEMVQYLVSLGVNVRAQNDYAVEQAAINEHLEIMRYLVSLGAQTKTGDLEMV